MARLIIQIAKGKLLLSCICTFAASFRDFTPTSEFEECLLPAAASASQTKSRHTPRRPCPAGEGPTQPPTATPVLSWFGTALTRCRDWFTRSSPMSAPCVKTFSRTRVASARWAAYLSMSHCVYRVILASSVRLKALYAQTRKHRIFKTKHWQKSHLNKIHTRKKNVQKVCHEDNMTVTTGPICTQNCNPNWRAYRINSQLPT